LDEFVRLGRDSFLARHGFARSRNYVVIDPQTGTEADSKAIAGVAMGYQYPDSGPLRPSDFSGGDATVAPCLQGLGFVVRHVAASAAGEDWTSEEVDLIVADYLSMLTQELTAQRYSKTAHRQRLMQLLPHRSAGSIEFKHANISAVMLEMGFPYLRGYKPRVNFQRRLLTEVVADQVRRHQVLEDAALTASQTPAAPVVCNDFTRVKVDAPRREHRVREVAPGYAVRAVKRDYLERESRNRSLGLAGELFAVDYERWRLVNSGLGRLAEQVRHVSQSEGDGLGYDLLSFEADGRERYIEVKTTSCGERTPFFVSDNEVRFARAESERFRLYRLYDFRSSPRLFELAGPIEWHCQLDPSTFRASFG
jgi:hypothetical protein